MTRRNWLTAFAATAVLVFGLGTTAPIAHAEGSVPATVWIILGKTTGSAQDPALAQMDALKQPPFDSFTDKKLLSKAKLELTGNGEAIAELPNGRKLKLSIEARDKDGRFHVKVSINRKGKPDYLPGMKVAAAPGDPFFIAGQKYQGGTLILGIVVGKSAAKK